MSDGGAIVDGPTRPREPDNIGAAWWRWAIANPSIALPIGASMLVVLRLWVSAHGDITSALGILQEAGVANVLFMSALQVGQILPLVVAIRAGNTLLPTARPPSASDLQRGWGLAVAALAGGLIFSSLIVAALSLGWILPMGIYGWIRAWRATASGETRDGAVGAEVPLVAFPEPVRHLGLAALAIVAALVIGNLSWGPSERLEISGRRRPIVGQVIRSDDRWTILLRAGVLSRVRTARIAKRTYCASQTGSGFANATIWNITGRANYPDCSSA